MKDFSEWLEAQLKIRELKPADLTYQTKIGTGTIYNVLNRTRKPGPDVCRAIANALNLPEETIFRRAGLLTSKPGTNESVEEVVYLFQQLSPEIQQFVLQALRAWVERGKNL